MNKITGITSNNIRVPITWGLDVTDNYWHNAVVMSTVMSRKIDTAGLWDGTISVTDRYTPIVLYNKLSLRSISDVVHITFFTPTAINQNIPVSLIGIDNNLLSLSSISEDLVNTKIETEDIPHEEFFEDFLGIDITGNILSISDITDTITFTEE